MQGPQLPGMHRLRGLFRTRIAVCAIARRSGSRCRGGKRVSRRGKNGGLERKRRAGALMTA